MMVSRGALLSYGVQAMGVRGNGGRAHLGNLASEESLAKTGSGQPIAVRIGARPAGLCPPSCGHGVGPWEVVVNQIRKVVEGMHWRMHDEPSFTIGSH